MSRDSVAALAADLSLKGEGTRNFLGEHDADCFGGLPDTFPSNVYRMIAACHDKENGTACFHPDHGFVIKNRKRIEEIYLKRYKVCQPKEKDDTPKFESFHRQLNKYGFTKNNESKKMIYRHKDGLFRQHCFDEVKRIEIVPTRKVSSRSGATKACESQEEEKVDRLEQRMDSKFNEVMSLLQTMDSKFDDVLAFLGRYSEQTHFTQGESNETGRTSGCKRRREDSASVSEDSFQDASHTTSVTESIVTVSSTSTIQSKKQYPREESGSIADSLSDSKDVDGNCCAPISPNENETVPTTSPDAANVSLPLPRTTKNPLAPTDVGMEGVADTNGSVATFEASESGDSIALPGLEEDFWSLRADLPPLPDVKVTRSMRGHRQRSLSTSSLASSVSTMTTGGTAGSLDVGIDRPSLYCLKARDSDVLCGDGDFDHHAGNKKYCALVAAHKLYYLMCGENEKVQISRYIVNEIKHRQGGLFLEQARRASTDKAGKRCWRELCDKKAVDMTTRALKEQKLVDPDSLGAFLDDKSGGNGGKGTDPEGGKDNDDKDGTGRPPDCSRDSGESKDGSESQGGSRGGFVPSASLTMRSLEKTLVPWTPTEHQEDCREMLEHCSKETNVIKGAVKLSNPDFVSSSTACEEEGGKVSTESREGGLDLKGTRSVSFGHVSVRKHTITLGDHPDCSRGPPVTLGWRFQVEAPVDINEYESRRTKRRSAQDLLMSQGHRREILTQAAGHTEWEIREATLEARRIQRQRQRTVRSLPFSRIQEAIQSAEKKLRGICNTKNCSNSHKQRPIQEKAEKLPIDSRVPKTQSVIRHHDSVAMLRSRAQVQ